MDLSELERQRLHNQFKILEKLEETESERYLLYQKILEKGFVFEYDILFEALSDEVPTEISKEVRKILNMHRNLNYSFKYLEDKEGLSNSDISFKGFDGNEEPKYVSYANFLLNDLNLYSELYEEDSRYDNGVSTLVRYRRMLSVIEAIDEKFGDLSAESIKSVINA